MNSKRFISGCNGLELTPDEIEFFKEHRPWGLILFARNCESRDQVGRLCESFRNALDWEDAPVFIDEEGGRVQRLKPPEWHSYPPGRFYGEFHSIDRNAARKAATLHGKLIAHDLREIGITVNCIPVLDVPAPNTTDAIGDRAFSSDSDVVAELAECVSEGLMSGGVLPVVKHIPGHGRSLVDSHLELPVIEANLEELMLDFKPFRKFRKFPFAITAHIVYRNLDENNPATKSKNVISKIIRDEIGFEGCLLSDDMSMHALSGSMGERTKEILDAGCDFVLHCNGKMEEMVQVAASAPLLTGQSERRAMDGLKFPVDKSKFDVENDRKEFQMLLESIRTEPKLSKWTNSYLNS